MRPSRRQGWLVFVTAALLVALASPVQADGPVEQLLPPSDLRAQHYDASTHTVRLTWMPPGNDTTTAFTYTVYRNASPVGTTTATWFDAVLDGSLNVFDVTASSNGNQSAPSQPMVVQQSSGGFGVWTMLNPWPGTISGPFCEIARIFTFTSFPFVSVTIHEECIPVIGKTIRIPATFMQEEGA